MTIFADMAVYNVKGKLFTAVLAATLLFLNAEAQPVLMRDGGTVLTGGRTEISCSITEGQIYARFIYDEPVPTDTIRLTIIGDVMMHRAQLENCHARYARNNGKARASDPSNYDFTPCLAPIRGILQGADICVANMEFTHSGPPFTGYPAFSAPESWSTYVAECGVDVFLMANNHILDGGPRGAKRTLEVYKNMEGVRCTGCYEALDAYRTECPLIVECRGCRIGIVNFTYGTNVPSTDESPKVCMADREEIADVMRLAREKADIIIVVPHWGEEYKLRHSQWQEEMGDFLLRNGANAIVGAHPHVVQDIETKTTALGKKVPVVYSLGNIISNMSATNTRIGLMVTLPVVIFSDGSVTLAEPEYTLTWCCLPGRLTDCHVTIPVRDWLGRRAEWKDPSDYDKMLDTYERILVTSGLSDK